MRGIGIALAWPQTLCKQAGAWYDKPLRWFGINKNNYYKVGHSAIVLINPKNGNCHYFDFGRYHSPAQHGRVRSAFTDHELEIKTKAKINSDGGLENFKEIVLELLYNTSCHGTGSLHAAYCKLNYNTALHKAIQLQQASPIRYGPFLPQGTNCSRFVNKVLLAGKPSFLHKLLLTAPKTLTPTPIGNVTALDNYFVVSLVDTASTFSIRGNFKINWLKYKLAHEKS